MIRYFGFSMCKKEGFELRLRETELRITVAKARLFAVIDGSERRNGEDMGSDHP